MPDGKIVFSTKIDNSNVDKDLKELEKKVDKEEKTITENKNKKLPLVEQAADLGAQLDEAKHKAEELRLEIEKLNSDMQPGSSPESFIEATTRIGAAEEELAAQEQKVERLQEEWDKVNDKIDEYDRKIKEANATIREATTQAAVMNKNAGGGSMQKAFEKAGDAAGDFKKQIISMAKSALIFSVIGKAFESIKNYMGKMLKSNKEFTASVSKLKAALMTAFQPLYERIAPALVNIINYLAGEVYYLAGVLSAMFGSTAEASADAAKKLNEEAEAMENLGEAAKKTSRSMAGFDEINKMSTGADGTNVGVDFNGIKEANRQAGTLVRTVAAIGAGLLAWKITRAFQGSLKQMAGVALIAGGAMAYVTSLVDALANGINWGNLTTMIAGAAAVVGGLALVFGSTAAAIGLVVTGAGLLIVAIMDVIRTGEMSTEAMAAIVVGILAIGAAISLLTGSWIPLIVAAVAGVVVAVATNWSKIVDAIRGPIGAIVTLVGGALLAVGAILTFSGTNLPLGIALMAAGAAGMVAGITANWGYIVSALQGPIGGVVALVGGALLAIGIILLCTGVGIPLGLGLIAAGAAGLAAAIAPNWNFLKDKVSGVWKGIVSWFKTNVAPVFTKQYWLNKWSNITSGLKDSFKNGINAAISLFNSFIRWINQKMTFSWKPFYIGGIKIFDGGGFKLMNIPEIPMLAKGAVIPPNAPFMAMLGDQRHGTNIEAPLETIQEAVAIVMEDMIQSNMAGHEATVGVLRDILGAVLGIHIGDDVIGQAAARYNSDMAIIRGGNR